MANLQLPLNQAQDSVLGSEYCSGYVDGLGKWVTGFYCPGSDESQDVFCCGSDTHKYCCTKKDQVIQTSNSDDGDLTAVVGAIVGAAAALLIVTLVSCFCCSCCFLYKKRGGRFMMTTSSSSSVYRLHYNATSNGMSGPSAVAASASEHSGVTHMYSVGNSGPATPQHVLDVPLTDLQRRQQHYLFDEVDHVRLVQSHNGGISHSYTLPHNLNGGGLVQQYMMQDDPDLIASATMRPYNSKQQQQLQAVPYHEPYGQFAAPKMTARYEFYQNIVSFCIKCFRSFQYRRRSRFNIAKREFQL